MSITPTPAMEQAFIEAHEAQAEANRAMRDYRQKHVEVSELSMEEHVIRLASMKIDQINLRIHREKLEYDKKLSELTYNRACPDAVYVRTVDDVVHWLKKATDEDQNAVQDTLNRLFEKDGVSTLESS